MFSNIKAVNAFTDIQKRKEFRPDSSVIIIPNDKVMITKVMIKKSQRMKEK